MGAGLRIRSVAGLGDLAQRVLEQRAEGGSVGRAGDAGGSPRRAQPGSGIAETGNVRIGIRGYGRNGHGGPPSITT